MQRTPMSTTHMFVKILACRLLQTPSRSHFSAQMCVCADNLQITGNVNFPSQVKYTMGDCSIGQVSHAVSIFRNMAGSPQHPTMHGMWSIDLLCSGAALIS